MALTSRFAELGAISCGRLGRGSCLAVLLACLLNPRAAEGGGSGLNTVVVANEASSNSLALANYFCERRRVPPQNVLRINWIGANTTWSLSDFNTQLAQPLSQMLLSRALTNQVEYVVVCMDIPYRVRDKSDNNSTTSALFYGFKSGDPPPHEVCELASSSTNLYAGSEEPFRLTETGSSHEHNLTVMLTGANLAEALRLVDQGAASDGTNPGQPVLLEKTSDTARNVRYWSFDEAMFESKLLGRPAIIQTNSDQTANLTNLLGLQTGLYALTVASNAFVPGAMADSLTSYAGYIFEPNYQTSLLAFIKGGASGSYGTIVEPCNYLEKFPDPMAYYLQGRGFSLAECYYQSLISPYQGLIVAEPLAAPFARPGVGRWTDPEGTPVLNGRGKLRVQFDAHDLSRPLQQVDLFVDGLWFQTLTNLPPPEGNLVSVSVNDLTTNYVAGRNATLSSVAEGLAAALNAASDSNRSGLVAVPSGDRVVLEWKEPSLGGSNLTLTATAAAGSADRLGLFVIASASHFLDSPARGWRMYEVSGVSTNADYLQATVAKTNGESLVLAVTNSTAMTSVQLVQSLLTMMNGTAALKGPDGLAADETYPSGSTNVTFVLRARSPGLQAAQIAVSLEGSTNLVISASTRTHLDENVGTLRPRSHLYLTAGDPNLAVEFSLDTSLLSDGCHELEAVAYEGSHVRTQSRTVKSICVSNSPLSAVLVSSAALGVAGVSEILRFSVTANTDSVAAIELFGTGGSLGLVGGQPSALFAVPASTLGVGLHPFHAVVMDTAGHRFRTETRYIRLSVQPAVPGFSVGIAGNPPILTWPAVIGHDYMVLSAGEVGGVFSSRDSLPASSTGTMQWVEPEPASGQRFYRVVAKP